MTGARGRRLILFALAAYAGVGCAIWIRRTEDFGSYLWSGESVLIGRHIYGAPPPGVWNTWPPFFSLLAVPLVLLDRVSPYLSRGAWLLANLVCLVSILRMLSRLIHGRTLGLAEPGVLVPLLLTDRFISTNLDHLQINILLFWLVLAGLVVAERGSARARLLGGVPIGLAAAIKLMPLAFLPYLALRRRVWTAISTFVVFLLLTFSPILVFGRDRFFWYARDYRIVLSNGWGVGKMNQSVFAMLDRWLGLRIAPLSTYGVNFVRSSGRVLPIAATGFVLLAIVVLAALAFRAPGGGEPRARAAEWGVVFIVAAAFAPIAWKAYYVVLLIPNMLLFAAWRDPRAAPAFRRTAGRLLLAASILAWLPSRGLVGKDLAGRLEMSASVTLAALVSLAGLLWLRARGGSASPAA
jgi:hypothetical protein